MSSEFPSFASFHRDVYGTDPFPWQSALADRVSADGRWPDTVNVPTGLGKTRSVAVAVWHLALQVHAAGPRTAPLRILHVVDRTSIVDQTHADLSTLAAALREPAGPAAKAVSDVLAAAYGDGREQGPLVISRIHGASPDDGAWHAVDRPTVVTMTAHQAVSRGLFRAFGVSPGMSPVHAALVGVDSLVLFDEPHLSAPAVKTLRAIKDHQADVGGVPSGQVVQLGATVENVGTVHSTTDADARHPVAAPRLAAAKTLHTVPCDPKETVKTLVDQTLVALDQVDGMVLVVANTIDVARTVHAKLTAGRKPAVSPSDAVLVTSRIRRRERQLADLRVASGGARLVVATQTVEAGVDLDATGLVTEVSDWPSLVQRLGRLNRRGDRPEAMARLVTPNPPRDGTKSVYGDNVAAAMTTLAHTFDGQPVGPGDLPRLLEAHADQIAAATRPSPPAPTLAAELLPTIAHTRPRPAADIDVQPFITGVEQRRRVTDVTVAWRASLDPAVLDGMPITPHETVTVPVAEVNGLLAARLAGKPATAGVVDDDGESSPAPATERRWHTDRTVAYVRRGDEWTPAQSHRDITPGGVVVLHDVLGGHDDTGWNPASETPVPDLSARIAHADGRWWVANPATIGDVSDEPLPEQASEFWQWALYDDPDQVDDLHDLLDDALDGRLGPRGTVQYGSITDQSGIWVRVPRHVDGMPEEVVTLAAHSAQVAHETVIAARRAGLDDRLVTVLEHAAWHHDDGKANSRFQAALGAGAGSAVLAKTPPDARFGRGLAPVGWRHEAASAAGLPAGVDPLVRHVVAAHHGWARPVMPPADGDGQNITTADEFAHLNEVYGPWGVAYLETVMRLADHRASAAPVPGTPPPTSDLPRTDLDGNTDVPEPIHLTGITVATALDWWAVAGLLAAATDGDPNATVTFSSGAATLHTVDALGDICGHVASICDDWHNHAGEHVAHKNEKVAAGVARDLVAFYTGPARRAVASLIVDTEPADTAGNVPIRAHWSHQNSGFLRSVDCDVDAVEQALTTVDAGQYDSDKAFGLVGYRGASAILTGVATRIRSALLPLVLAAHSRLPATGSARPAGITTDNRVALPMPTRPTTWVELVALLQSTPDGRDWTKAGIDTLNLTRITTEEGKVPTWEPVL